MCYCLNVVRLKFTFSTCCFNPCPADHNWNALNGARIFSVGQVIVSNILNFETSLLQSPKNRFCYTVIFVIFLDRITKPYPCHNTRQVCQEKYTGYSLEEIKKEAQKSLKHLISPSPWKNVGASLFWNRISLENTLETKQKLTIIRFIVFSSFVSAGCLWLCYGNVGIIYSWVGLQ